MAALAVINPHVIAHLILNALQHGDVAGGGAVIVANEGSPAVGVGPNHADGGQIFFAQRQDAVVFQQDDALFGGLDGVACVGFALHIGVGDIVKFGVLAVHDAQQIPGGKQTHGGLTDVCLRNQLLRQGGEQAAVGAAAV